MRRHTIGLAERAWDIAEREAEKVWEATGDYYMWYEAIMNIYEEVLKEFQPLPEPLLI